MRLRTRHRPGRLGAALLAACTRNVLERGAVAKDMTRFDASVASPFDMSSVPYVMPARARLAVSHDGGVTAGQLRVSVSKSAPRVAKGVTFDGASFLTNPALVAPGAGAFSCSLWIRQNLTTRPWAYYWANLDAVDADLNTSRSVDLKTLVIDLYPAAGPASLTGFTCYPADNTLIDGEWMHLLYSADNLGTATPRMKLYVDGVDTPLTVDAAGPGGFVPAFDGKAFYVAGEPSNFESSSFLGDMADYWLAPGVSLLDGGGDIPLATRRLFTDATGHPVSPEGFPEAAVLLTGPASSFARNRGTGGDFTLTGALTDAVTSPSDTDTVRTYGTAALAATEVAKLDVLEAARTVTIECDAPGVVSLYALDNWSRPRLVATATFP